MQWFDHSDLKDKHAFLGASKYHWINYDDQKIESSYRNFLATQKGTELHEFAYNAIRLRIPLKDLQVTLNMYVNDAIGYHMEPEQVLYYSENAFGTADAICFRDNLLRIHDLKTGKTKASIKQLYVYAALFCLEYKRDPYEIDMELRIYQSNKIFVDKPDPKSIAIIMNKIVAFDRRIEEVKTEG